MYYFSIVIPVYNVAPYLRDCLDSVLAQTFTDWEAICVNDGSTDGSGAILDEYAAIDQRFKVVHKTNAGVSAARNVALGLASGMLIVFLDSDDVLAKDSLSVLYDTAKKNPKADMLYFGLIRFDDGDEIDWSKHGREAKLVDVSKRLTCSDVMKDTLGLAYRRELVNQSQFARFAFHEDRVYYVEALVKANAYYDVGRPLYGYRMRGGSVTHSPERSAEETQCAISAFPKMLSLLIQSARIVDDNVMRSFSNYILERIPYQIMAQERSMRAQLWGMFFREVACVPVLKGVRNFRWALYKRTKSRLNAVCFGAMLYWFKVCISQSRKHLHM